MSDVIRTLERVGTPPTVIGALQTLDGSLTPIRAEGYRTDKETEHIGKAQQVAVDRLQKYLEQDEAAAGAERDRELKALDAELAERASIPRKRIDESDAAYNARVVVRAIEESRRTNALLLALCDVQAISMATDPDVIAAAVDEAPMTRADPMAISRIGRAAEAKLKGLAADESRNGEPGQHSAPTRSLAKSCAPGAPGLHVNRWRPVAIRSCLDTRCAPCKHATSWLPQRVCSTLTDYSCARRRRLRFKAK